MKKYYEYMDKDININNELLRKIFFILNAPSICANQEIKNVDNSKKKLDRQKYIKCIKT